MGVEIITFANFDFEIRKTTTNVIVGDRVQNEERYGLNWKEYVDVLAKSGFDVSPSRRPFFPRYQKPMHQAEFFNDFLSFQDEIRRIIEIIGRTRRVPLDVWNAVFREAEKLSETILPVPEVKEDVSERLLDRLNFEKRVTSETYRGYLFAELRELIVGRKVFRLRKCPECAIFFMDRTKNGNKVYCSSSSCGNRAKQRAFQERRARSRPVEKVRKESGLGESGQKQMAFFENRLTKKAGG